MKELKIMEKTLRYLLIVMMVSVASMVFATAQNLAQQPQVQMQSTSIMAPCGSALPQAAVTGAVTTYSTNSAAKVPGRRRALDGGDDTPEKPDGPMQDPLGDAMLPMLLCAAVFCGVIAIRRKRSAIKG